MSNFELQISTDEDTEKMFADLIQWDDISDAVLWQALTTVEEAAPSAPVPPSAELDDVDEDEPPKTDTKSSFVKLSEEELNKIEEGKDEKTTKQTTAWGVKRFKSKSIFVIVFFLLFRQSRHKNNAN